MAKDIRDGKAITVAEAVAILQTMPPDAVLVRREKGIEPLNWLRIRFIGKPAIRKHIDGRCDDHESGTYPGTTSATVAVG